MGCIIWTRDGLFCSKSGFLTANSTFLHFYVFTWGLAHEARIWARHGLLCPNFGLETANFTFLHGVLIMGCKICARDVSFCQKSGFLTAISTFLNFYIFTLGWALGFRTWGRDGLFCPHFGLEASPFLYGVLLIGYRIWARDGCFWPKSLVSSVLTSNFTFLHFYMGVSYSVWNLGSGLLILSKI